MQDVNWKPDDKGNPATAPQGCPDTTIPWQYITQPPNGLYFPTAPEYPQVLQDAEKQCCRSRRSPEINVYSPTYASKCLVLNQLVYNTIGEVVLGRQPVSGIEKLIKDWRA